MEAQEAKEILKDGVENICLPILQPVYEVAIEALEKQIPKKMNNLEVDYDICGECPKCGASLAFEKQDTVIKYCSECGQRLEWGD